MKFFRQSYLRLWIMLFSGVGLIVISFSIDVLAPRWRWNQPHFHAITSGLGAYAALTLAILLVMLQKYRQIEPAYIWIAGALVTMGILDGFHAGVHIGLIFVWSHSLSTFLGGGLFALVWMPDRITAWARDKAIHKWLILVAVAISLISFGISQTFPGTLPVMVADGEFTMIARLMNIAGGAGFIAAAFYFYTRTDSKDAFLFANHSLLFGVAGLLFEFSKLWDGTWWLWHLLRVMAYGIGVYYFFLRFRWSQEESRRVGQRFKNLVESTGDIVWELNAQGVYTYVSPRVEFVLGYENKKVVGKTPFHFMIPEDAERVAAEFKEIAGLKEPFTSLESRNSCKDGRIKVLEARGVPFFTKDGEFCGYRGIDRDITRRKRAENAVIKANDELEKKVEDRTKKLRDEIVQRKHAEKELRLAKEAAEEANIIKSKFLTKTSQELRTPLHTVVGASFTMQQKIFGPLDSGKYMESINSINDSGIYLLRLVDDIIDVSALDIGKLDLNKTAFDVSKTIDFCMRQIRFEAGKNQIHLIKQMGENPPILYADKSRVEQILSNLLSNAVKFTNPDGEVKVSTRLKEDGFLAITVSDTGIGISKEDIPLALSPFWHANSDGKLHHESTRLGLHLCLRLMELHGGALDVASKGGSGTDVTMCFPPEVLNYFGTENSEQPACNL